MKSLVGVIFGIVLFTQCAGFALADENPENKNWKLVLGAGAALVPKYDGSESYKVVALPFLSAHYKMDATTFYYEMDRAGVRQSLGHGISAGGGLRYGGHRRTSHVGWGYDGNQDELVGTQKLDSSPIYFFDVSSFTPIGSFKASLNYSEIRSSYDEPGRPSNMYFGKVVDVGWSQMWRRGEPLGVNAGISLSWMDADYAEAYYSVKYATPYMQVFKADQGFGSVKTNVGLTYQISGHWSSMFFGSLTYYLNDAQASPFTKSPFRPGVFAVVLYNFGAD